MKQTGGEIISNITSVLRNKIGPSTDPWGTPELTVRQSEHCLSIRESSFKITRGGRGGDIETRSLKF